jgi:hypothetical protein
VDDRSPANLPLRELFTQAERLNREVIEHLEQSFMPRVNDLERLVRGFSNAAERTAISDVAIRNAAASVIKSDEFAQKLYKKMQAHVLAIHEGTRAILSNE